MATSVTRWSPMTDIVNFRNAFDRLWEETFRPTRNGEELGPSGLGMDVAETNDSYIVTAAIPGVAPEDVNIEIDDDVLTISGEFERRGQQEDAQYIRQELRYGSFKRSLRLPPTVDAEHAEAKFEHGMLNLVLPKKPEARARTLKITPKGVIEGSKK